MKNKTLSEQEEIIKSIQTVIQAINDDSAAIDFAFVDACLQKMFAAPYKGRGLGIGSHRTGRITWEEAKTCLSFKKENTGYSSGLDYLTVLLELFDRANISEDDMFAFAQQITGADIIYNHVLEHILENLVELEEIEKAEKYIPHFKTTRIFKEENNFDLGYRIILRHYAKQADVDNFFKTFKLCEPRKDRYDMDLIKMLLVKACTEKHGIETALQLCNHKNIGERYFYYALSVFAEKGEYEKLKSLFIQYPQLKQPEQETELKILAQAYIETAKDGFELDDREFEDLFNRALQVNPKLKWGDARLRDSILFDLALASKNNKDRAIRCRKAIKNNWLKKELNSPL
jgi:hypothetical protein